MKTLIIDANYLCHRALHTTGDLEFEEVKSGVVFGFLRQLKTIGNHFKSNSLLFCWDSRKSKRKIMYPAYKENRNKDDKLDETEKEELRKRRESAFKQFTELRKELLPGIGFKNMYIQQGYEADDLIAKIAMERDDDFVIITADEDLYQLLEYADLYKPQSKQYVTLNSFQEEFGIHSKQWSRVKAIAGCTSDNISGVNGVGDKTAAKYLNGSLKGHTKTFRKIESSYAQTQNNLQLTELPLKGTKLFKIKEDSFSMDYFYNMCVRYGINTFLDEAKKWNKFFKGEFR